MMRFQAKAPFLQVFLLALLLLPVSAQAKQAFKAYGTVGQWAIQTVRDDGKLSLCRAVTRTPGGDVNLILYPSGRWAITVPDLKLTPGTKLKGVLEVGGVSHKVEMTAGAAGLRERVLPDKATVRAMRGGGPMSLKVGGKTFAWDMKDAGQAMGAVEDCLIAAKKTGG